MKNLDQLLEFNEKFVKEQAFLEYETDKFPNKKMVILSCMDTRLVELLPKAMNLKNGDFKIIKNAGAIVSHPFGSVMKSILIAVYELKAEEILVIGHYDCGMSNINGKKMICNMIDRGISREIIHTLEHAGFPLENWLTGFEDVEESVINSVNVIKNHPLLLPEIPVHGLIIDPATGKLKVVINGYSE